MKDNKLNFLTGLLTFSLIALVIGIGLMIAYGINAGNSILIVVALLLIGSSIYGIYNRRKYHRGVGKWMSRTSKTYNPYISITEDTLTIENNPTSVHYKSKNR